MSRIIDLAGMSAIGYTRVSTEEQAREKQTSLADQRAAVAVLAEKLGVTIGHVFEDAGASGAWDDRPAFAALIASCKASPRRRSHPALVLVLNDSRWGRFDDPEDSTFFRREIGRIGWHVRFAEQDEITDPMLRSVFRAITQGQATQYRTTLKANVLRGCRGQAEQGYWQAKAPFGYLRCVVYPPGRERSLDNHVPKATDEKLVLIPHAEEAPIVREIFNRYVQGGESLASLLEWASRAYPSRDWSRAAMLRLLTNPAYIGDIVWGRMAVEPGRRTTRSASEWYGKRDAHPALVSRDVFAAAQARLSINRHRTRGVRSDWILSGIVRCRCGAGFVGHGDTGPKGGGPVYRCANRVSASKRCTYPGAVTKKLLEETTIAVLSKEIGSAVHRRAMESVIDRVLEESHAQARTADDIARDLDSVRQRQARVVTAIESGTLHAQEARDRMNALRREHDALLNERSRSGRSGGDLAAWRDALVSQALDFRSMAADLKGPALRELVSQWLHRAEFNTATRELTMEIRRVPAMTLGAKQPASSLSLGDFGTEGDPSGTKTQRKASGLDATITRRVIVGRRRSA